MSYQSVDTLSGRQHVVRGREHILLCIWVVEDWKDHFAQHGVTQRDIDLYAEQIDRPFLHDQRRDFVG